MNLLESAFRGVLDTSWRTTWLILLVLGIRWALRDKVSGRLLFGIWILVGFRLLLPISVETSWSPFNLWASLRPIADPFSMMVPATPPTSPLDVSKVAPTLTVQPPFATFSWIRMPSLLEGASLVWGLGVLVLLSARLAAIARFARRIRGTTFPPHHPDAIIPESAADLLAQNRLSLVTTSAVSGPALFGLWHPRILFPPGLLSQLSATELRLTLAHEIAHARRRDLLADTLLHLAVILHWFNPLVWIAANVSRRDCEAACDESVMRAEPADERGHYAATLIKIVRFTNTAPRPEAALGVVGSKLQIKRRINMIVANPRFTWASAFSTLAAVLTLAVLSFTGETAAQITSAAPVAQALRGEPASRNSEVNGIKYDPSVDRLDIQFPTGIVATIADRTITPADVRRYIAPLIPNLQGDSRSQEEFNGKLTRLQNFAIKDLVERAVLIRQFHDRRDGEQERRIAAELIDTSIADEIAQRFEGDRGKFLDHLRDRNLTVRQYRTEVEENIMLNYMRAQERKISGTSDTSKRSQPQADPERNIHLRMIELKRAAGENDAALVERANAIIDRFRSGEDFAGLAREFDVSIRRERGGDWGWMGLKDIRAPFHDAFTALQKGTVANPIIVSEGCFIMYAQDRR